MKGLVIKNTGSWVTVRLEDGSGVVNCKMRGVLRLKGLRCTNPVAVGDIVQVEDKGGDAPVVGAIEPRKNYIIRRASNLSKEFQIIAANLDQAVLVATLFNPETSTTFIDRFLATAEAYQVPAVLAFNKIDLLVTEESREYLNEMKAMYERIGYPVITMSAATGEGADQLRDLLKGKMSLLSGNSGVGKSSIINLLVPDANVRVGDVSHTHHKGMHTTTFSELLDLPGGGAIIDTPGVKAFGTIDFERAEVAHYFPEIFKISAECRFNNCMHTHEPGCAVLAAVEQGEIAYSRFVSYLSILDEDPNNKYRKPF
ncbi:MAG: ribosome small subunit-dependent GTPase A [Muribaculaceae bacterium]|nr:ribosome small subunit-dependent GTPase A [Muribaculaceae bacterium]